MIPAITTNPVIPAAFRLTMTSREIADLTGKDLSHIHRDTRTMLDELAGIDDPDLDHVREDKDARGYTTCFHLQKSLTITLMAGYSVKMRHAIVKRWQELEAPAAPAALSRMEILTLALDSEKKAVEAEAQLKLAAPAIAHLQAVESSRDDFTFQEMAHVLQEHGYRLGRNRLMDVLRRAGVLTKASNLPTQDYRERGYFRVVESIRESSTGRKHVDLTTYLTGKGHNWLTKAMDGLLLKSAKIGGAA